MVTSGFNMRAFIEVTALFIWLGGPVFFLIWRGRDSHLQPMCADCVRQSCAVSGRCMQHNVKE